MTSDQREIRRKLRVLKHAETNGSVVKTCRYFGIGRASFYRWKNAYVERGEAGLVNGKTIPKWHANRTPPAIEEKVLHPREKYHLGLIRIMWCLERYQKQVSGPHIQMDVKFLTFIGKADEKTHRFQYTAIDDATRVRAFKV